MSSRAFIALRSPFQNLQLSPLLSISWSYKNPAICKATAGSFATSSLKLKDIDEAEDPDVTAARQWLAGFSRQSIPDNVGEVSYARSSGPGGQNVNKLNTKSLLRMPLSTLTTALPNFPASLLIPILRTHPYYAPKSNALLISSDASRKQAQNRETCYVKLAEAIQEVGRKVVPGETSERQKEKVRGLRRGENERRLRDKRMRKGKKASRGRVGD